MIFTIKIETYGDLPEPTAEQIDAWVSAGFAAEFNVPPAILEVTG